MEIANDKKQHFIGGILLAIFGAGLTFLPWWGSALALTVAASVAKEIWDKVTGRGTPEVLDAVAGIAGGSLATILLYLLIF